MTGQSKLNNEVMVTDAMRERLNNLYSLPARVEEDNRKLKEVDKNMFAKITDETEHYLLGAEQIVYGAINGNALQDNLDLYNELEVAGKKPKLIKVIYDNLINGNLGQYTIVNIIKKDGLYYIRDRSNFKDECMELGWWFLDRKNRAYTRGVMVATFTRTGVNEVNCVFNCEEGRVWRMVELNDAMLERRRTFSKFELKERTKHLIYNRKGKRIR